MIITIISNNNIKTMTFLYNLSLIKLFCIHYEILKNNKINDKEKTVFLLIKIMNRLSVIYFILFLNFFFFVYHCFCLIFYCLKFYLSFIIWLFLVLRFYISAH